MYCNECQSEIPDNSIICYVCGKKIQKDTAKIKIEDDTTELKSQIHPIKVSLVIVSALIVLIGCYLSFYYINDYIQQKKLEEQYLAGTNYVKKQDEPGLEEQKTEEETQQEAVTPSNTGDYEITTPVEGELMPAFHFTDLYGNTVTLENLLSGGKAVYVTTFTTWCTYCTREMADMTTLATNYRDVLQFVFIDLGEGFQATFDYHLEHGLQVGQVGYVDTWALGGTSIEAVPQSYVLSKEGILVKAVLGEQSYGQIEQNIVDALLYNPAQ
jgi:thiol-disulfide isomerase/thioredoxin